MTNYERIKSMSVEEMARFIMSIYTDCHHKCLKGYAIPEFVDEYKINEWLNAEWLNAVAEE